MTKNENDEICLYFKNKLENEKNSEQTAILAMETLIYAIKIVRVNIYFYGYAWCSIFIDSTNF